MMSNVDHQYQLNRYLRNALDCGDVYSVDHYLSEGANVNVLYRDGVTPLLISIHNKHVPLIQCVIRHNADVNRLDEHESTPLHSAVESSCAAVVGALVRSRANVNAFNGHNITPLHLAMVRKSHVIVQRLIASGGSLEMGSKEACCIVQQYCNEHDIGPHIDCDMARDDEDKTLVESECGDMSCGCVGFVLDELLSDEGDEA